MAVKIALAIASIGFSAVSYTRQRSQRKKLEERLRESRAQTLRPHAAGADVPVAYGRTVVEGLLAYPGTTGSAVTVSGTRIGSLNVVSGRKNEFLLTQYVISAGEIEKVVDVWNGDEPIASGEAAGHIVVAWRNGGAAEPMATAFTADRAAADTFDGLAYLTVVARHDRDDPKVLGLPSPLAFVKGRKTRNIRSSGNQIFRQGDTFAYSPNAIRILADYLTNADFGPGLARAELDRATWRAAQEIADQVVQGANSDIWSQPYPTALNTMAGTSYTRYSDYLNDLDFGDEADTGWLDTPVTPSTDTPAALIRHEYNGVVSSSRNYPDTIDQILSTIPDARLWRAVDGKWKISLGDSLRTEAAQSVMTVDADKLLAPVVVAEDAAGRLNQVTIRFADANKRFAQSSVTWPADNGALHTALLNADGGINLHRVLDIPGVATSYHAASIAATTVLLSRRKTISFRMILEGALLEPGDVVRVEDPIQGVETWVRLEAVSLRSDLTVEASGLEFFAYDYAWQSDEMAVLAALAAVDETIGAPKSVTVTQQDGLTTIQWVAADDEDAAVNGYEIERNTAAMGAEWQAVAVVGRDARAFPFVPQVAAGNIKCRVRAVTPRGRVSPWTEGDTLSLSALSGSDSSVAEFVFTRTNTSTAPATPTSGDERGAVPVGWANNPTGPSATLRWEWVSVRRQAEDDADTDWTPWSAPALWSRWSADGNGIEFVYTATETSTAPTAITTDATARAMDEHVPTGWFDDPPAPTDAKPFVWVSARRGTTGVWGEFNAPTLFLRSVEDGAGVEYIFRLTAANTAPTTPTTTTGEDATDDHVPTDWFDDPPSTTTTMRFLWVSIRRGSTKAWGKFSAPALYSAWGTDGRGVEYIYKAQASAIDPAAPTTTTTEDKTDDHVPTGWTDDPSGVDITNRYEFVSQRIGSTEAWGKFSSPGLFSRYGEDGAGREFIYRRTIDTNAPDTPTTDTTQDAADDHVPTGWTDEPSGASETNPVEWVSVRKRARGAASWGKFSAPAAWSFFGSGEDGAGIEWVFIRNNNASFSTKPDDPSDRTVNDHVPDGWADDPPSPTATNKFVWASIRRKGQGSDSWGDFSTPALWARFALDGSGAEFVFRRTANTTAPALTQPSGSADDQVPANWSDDPVGVDATNPVEWVAKRTGTTGNWGDFSTPKIWALFGSGEDGSGVEFIYRAQASATAPATPSTNKTQDETDDHVPTGWTDNPTGVSATNKYEFVSLRTGSKEDWGKFSAPALFSRYGEDGAGREFVFRRTTDTNSPGNITTTSNQDNADDHVPTGWSDDPAGVDETNIVEWVATRKRSRGGTAWGKFTAPRIWAIYGEGEDGAGREFVFHRTQDDTAPDAITTTTTEDGQDDYVPSGWSRTKPTAGQGETVYQTSRTLRFTGGEFTSATAWGNVTEST